MDGQRLNFQILRIIGILNTSSPAMRTIYTNGACYRLYELLHVIFPEAEPYLDSTSHVVTKINGRYYDITGERLLTKPPIRMDAVDIACAEAASICHLNVTGVRAEPWPQREEMIREIESLENEYAE